MKINIEKINNGFIVDISQSTKDNGRYSYRFLDSLQLLEKIGNLIAEQKVSVKLR